MPSNFWGDPNQLVGKCPSYRDLNCVGTAKGWFHVHLALLGKTTNTSFLEEKYPVLRGNITQTSNSVFLFDVEQLAQPKPIDSEVSTTTISSGIIENHPNALKSPETMPLSQRERLESFRTDLQQFLGLSQPIQTNPPQKRPGKVLKKKLQKQRNRYKINICEDQYQPLRAELMTLSKEISVWIRTSGFLKHPDVIVSNPDYFETYLLGEYYMNDPCPSTTMASS